MWECITLVPADRPWYSLSSALLPMLEPRLHKMTKRKQLKDIRKLADDLTHDQLALRDVVTNVLEDQQGTDRLLVFVDQWGELYTYDRNSHAQENGNDKAREASKARKRFIDELLEATEHCPLTMVFTLRADFYGEALSHRGLSDRLQESQVNLGPMTREELHRAITQPAEKIGLALEPGLVDRLLDDVGQEPGSLPLLEYALKDLWSNHRGNHLCHECYDSMGGLKGAIAKRAEDILACIQANQILQVG